MTGLRGKGVQKQARMERLKKEIETYVSSRPGCSAADIVAYLSNERKMRNHGLTARKVGYFIPDTCEVKSASNWMQPQASASTMPLFDQTFNPKGR